MVNNFDEYFYKKHSIMNTHLKKIDVCHKMRKKTRTKFHWITSSSLAHVFSIRGRRKRGPGTFQTCNQNLPK